LGTPGGIDRHLKVTTIVVFRDALRLLATGNHFAFCAGTPGARLRDQVLETDRRERRR